MGVCVSLLRRVDRSNGKRFRSRGCKGSIREAEKELILQVLTRTRWNGAAQRRSCKQLQGPALQAETNWISRVRRIKERVAEKYEEILEDGHGDLLLMGRWLWRKPPHRRSLRERQPDATTSVAGPDYVIGPEDVLHIAVWKIGLDGHAASSARWEDLAASLTMFRRSSRRCS